MTNYVRNNNNEVEATTADPRAVVTQDHYHNSLEGGQGDYGIQDIEIPRLDIVHNVGDLSAKFPNDAGELVLMREFIIPQPVRVTVFGHAKYYVQNTEYEEGVSKKEFDTEAQVVASGGNLDRGKKAGEDDNNFLAAARLYLAIELPANLSETVPGVLELEDKYVARAIWKVQKSAFTQIIRRINLVEAPLKLKGKFISSKSFDLTTDRQKLGKHWVWLPELKVIGDNTEEYLTFLRRVF